MRAMWTAILKFLAIQFREDSMFQRRVAIAKTELLIVFLVVIVLGLGAAYWMGAKQTPNQSSPSTAPPATANSLSEEDRQLVAKQKMCPVSGQPLDSMSGPFRTEVKGTVVFVCCKNCTSALNKDPEKYLAKLK
jgi:YHS domain-containing protein